MKVTLMLATGGVLMAACISEEVKANPIDFKALGGSVLISQGGPGESRVYLKSDGTYVLTIPGRMMRNGSWDSRGEWRADGTNLCTRATNPLPAEPFREEFCQPIPVRNYGESWTVDSKSGKVKVIIERGETDQ